MIDLPRWFMHSLPSVRTSPSPISGLGVFAIRQFSAGEVVLTIDDRYVVSEAHPIPQGEENHCDQLQGGRVVWMQEPERHINHSCWPNVFIQTEDSVRHVVALRDIEVGDEITYDYSVNGYGDTVWHCSCGSPRCRKDVHSDFFHLPVAIQLEYLPLLDDRFRQEHAIEIDKLLRLKCVDPTLPSAQKS